MPLDDFQALRQRNRLSATGAIGAPAFNPSGRVPDSQFGPAPQQEKPLFNVPDVAAGAAIKQKSPEEQARDELLQMYQPDTRASDMFINMMENVPQRERPGPTRAILGGLATLNPHEGMKAAEQIQYGPYLREMGDFKMRADLLKDVAGAERAGNVNERMIMSQVLRDMQQDRAARTREGQLVESTRAAQARETETARSNRAREDAITVMNNIRRIHEDKTLSDPQKIALTSKYRMDLEKLRQEGAINLAGEVGEIDLIQEQYAQANRERLAEVKDANDPELATQRKVGEYLKARQAYNTNPEWRKDIKLGNPATNDFTVTSRKVFMAGYRPEAQAEADAKYKAIVDYIYGPGGVNPADAAEGGTIQRPNLGPVPAPPSVRRTGKRPQTRVLRNPTTGERKQQVSRDGGATWEDQ